MLYISTFQYISGSPKQPVVHGDVYGNSTNNRNLGYVAGSRPDGTPWFK
ncbi:MAG: hypothetical protein J6I60_07055 [Bacteroidaceae bacterium]|nr:hypothetical protein [Bacteroidaceae bacterium]